MLIRRPSSPPTSWHRPLRALTASPAARVREQGKRYAPSRAATRCSSSRVGARRSAFGHQPPSQPSRCAWPVAPGRLSCRPARPGVVSAQTWSAAGRGARDAARRGRTRRGARRSRRLTGRVDRVAIPTFIPSTARTRRHGPSFVGLPSLLSTTIRHEPRHAATAEPDHPDPRGHQPDPADRDRQEAAQLVFPAV